MGYQKHKYTKEYFLGIDEKGNRTSYGVEGIEFFRNGNLRSFDESILKHIDFTGMKVLDFGFGRGEEIKYALEHKASHVVGVDFSETATNIAKDFLSEYGLSAEIYTNDALTFLSDFIIKNPTYKFDIVIMLDFIEHLPRYELKQILVLLRKVLRNNSLLVVNTPIFKVDNDVMNEGLNLLASDTSDYFDETAGMHCNRYTLNSLKKFFLECGYEAISGHYFVPRNSPFFPYSMEKLLIGNFPLKFSAFFYKNSYEYAYVKPVFNWTFIKIITYKLLHYLEKRISEFRTAYLQSAQQVIEQENNKPVLEYKKVKSGPFKDGYLLLNIKYPTNWVNEMENGNYDAFIYKRIKDIEGMTIWDIGAHIGYHTLAFAKLVGETGTVICFEPNIYNLRRLRQNISNNSSIKERIKVYTYAISSSDGESEFIVSTSIDNGLSSGSHLSNIVPPERQSSYCTFKEMPVTTVTIDTLVNERSFPIPHIMKIDVEGAEFEVLRGAERILKIYKPQLFIEVHNILNMFYIQNFLDGLGYKLEILNEEGSSISRCFIYANFLSA